MGLALLAASLALFPSIASPSIARTYAALIGLSGGVITVVFFAAWGHLFGQARLGEIQGVAQFVTVLASALGPLVMAEGRAWSGSYSATFYVLAAVTASLGVAAVFTPLPEKPAKIGDMGIANQPASRETTLITGASSGIGYELARIFAAHNSNLVLVARRRESLESLAATLQAEHSIEVTVLACDLTEPSATRGLEQQLSDRGIIIDQLVNNAGFGAKGKFSKLSIEQQLDMIRLNVVALTDLTRRFLPGMLRRNHGAILNVASTAAFQPGPNMAVYFATKAFVLSLTEAIAHEVRDSEVRVTCLCPGATMTEFGDHAGASETLLFRLRPMTADQVARFGYKALRRGTKVAVPGLGNWLTSFLVRFVPRTVACRIAERLVA